MKVTTLLIMTTAIYMVLLVAALATAIKNEPSAPLPVEPEGTPILYDVYKTCQTLSATRTNKDWRYDDCINQLRHSLGKDMPEVEST